MAKTSPTNFKGSGHSGDDDVVLKPKHNIKQMLLTAYPISSLYFFLSTRTQFCL